MKEKIKAKELLSGPEKWTKGSSGRDVNGQFEPPDSQKAVQFCLLGALQRCYGYGPEYWGMRDKLAKTIDPESFEPVDTVIGFNDNPGRTFEEVKAILEEADV